jgi:hypothetical protein
MKVNDPMHDFETLEFGKNFCLNKCNKLSLHTKYESHIEV